MDRVNVAVIGVGVFGRHHVRVYKNLKEANLVAICDVNEERAKEIGKLYSVKYYTNLEEMFEREDIEAVSIVVPTSKHYEVAMKVFKYNVHALIEKPLASNVKEAEEIVREARKRNLKLMVGHLERFNPIVDKVKEIIKKGKYGRLVSIHAYRLGLYPTRVQDVGVTVDWAIHDVDVMRFIVGDKVTTVYGLVDNWSGQDSISLALLKFRNGVYGSLEANWNTSIKVRGVRIVLRDAIMNMNYIKQEVKIYTRVENAPECKSFEEFVMRFGEPSCSTIRVKIKEPLENELRLFLKSIINGEDPPVSGEDGIENLRIIEAILESCRTGKCIKLH